MSRLLFDDFQALCAKLIRHPDPDVCELVEEAMGAREAEESLAKTLAFASADGLSPDACLRAHREWALTQWPPDEVLRDRGDA